MWELRWACSAGGAQSYIRWHYMLGPGLAVGVEAGLEIFPSIPLPGDSLPSPSPHPHLGAVSDSWHRPVSTNPLGQDSLFALPRAKPGGLDPEVLCYSAKKFFPCLPPFMRGKSNPEVYALMAPSQVLKCHFWGTGLPRAGCNLQGNQSFSSPSHLCWWWWASCSPHPPLGDPAFSNTT